MISVASWVAVSACIFLLQSMALGGSRIASESSAPERYAIVTFGLGIFVGVVQSIKPPRPLYLSLFVVAASLFASYGSMYVLGAFWGPEYLVFGAGGIWMLAQHAWYTRGTRLKKGARCSACRREVEEAEVQRVRGASYCRSCRPDGGAQVGDAVPPLPGDDLQFAFEDPLRGFDSLPVRCVVAVVFGGAAFLVGSTALVLLIDLDPPLWLVLNQLAAGATAGFVSAGIVRRRSRIKCALAGMIGMAIPVLLSLTELGMPLLSGDTQSGLRLAWGAVPLIGSVLGGLLVVRGR